MWNFMVPVSYFGVLGVGSAVMSRTYGHCYHKLAQHSCVGSKYLLCIWSSGQAEVLTSLLKQ